MSCIVLDRPEQIRAMRNYALLHSLRLEVQGFQLWRITTYSIVKREFNLKGNKLNVYNQFAALLGKPAYEPLASWKGCTLRKKFWK